MGSQRTQAKKTQDGLSGSPLPHPRAKGWNRAHGAYKERPDLQGGVGMPRSVCIERAIFHTPLDCDDKVCWDNEVTGASVSVCWNI